MLRKRLMPSRTMVHFWWRLRSKIPRSSCLEAQPQFGRRSSLLQYTEPVAPVKSKLPHKIRHHGAIYLRLAGDVSERSLAQLLHFLPTALVVPRRFLLVMNAETGEKSPQPRHLETCGLGAQHEVPVHRI